MKGYVFNLRLLDIFYHRDDVLRVMGSCDISQCIMLTKYAIYKN